MILFCNDVLNPSAPDTAFAHEIAAAKNAVLSWQLVDYEKLVAGQTDGALRRVREHDVMQTAIYRGWMWRVEDYTRLYNALQAKNISLINTPAQYEHCHHLPSSLAIIEKHTPRTVVIPIGEISSTQTAEAVRSFGEKPLIVKDFVKSRKHDWHEACFISNAKDADEVERVTSRFIELQGENLVGGLVLREFMNFKSIGAHSQSAMPLTKEYRLFFFDGELLCRFEYWNDGDYSSEAPPDDLFCDVARQVQSRFFTMDVAQREDNDEWMIVELGDAQVSGLPRESDAVEFYEKLRAKL